LKAAELGTSVSALVKCALQELGSHESKAEGLKRQGEMLRERIKTFRASDRLPRDERPFLPDAVLHDIAVGLVEPWTRFQVQGRRQWCRYSPRSRRRR
jgi:hypothetical protein